jgi:hypothetical protein
MMSRSRPLHAIVTLISQTRPASAYFQRAQDRPQAPRDKFQMDQGPIAEQ